MKNKYLLSLALGIVLLVSSMAMGAVLNAIFPGLTEEYAGPGFRQMDDPMWVLFLFYPPVLGILMAYIWSRTKKAWKGGLDFGLSIGIFLSVPMLLVNLSSFSFSLLMVFSWSVFGFLNSVIAGLLLEKLDK